MAMIKNIWAENTNNKNANFTETRIGDGIEAKSSILSSQLNGIAYRDEKFIDLLQRANAYNPNRVYNQGDLCFVAVDFKRAIDTAGKRYIMIFTSNLNNNTAEPLVKKNATSFSVDNSLAVPLYTIVQNDSTTMLSSYANSAYWNANDMTMGDLSNAVNLVVSGNSTFKKSLNIDGNLTMPSASMSNGVLTANTISTTNLSGFSFDTPSYTLNADAKNAINAEWFYKKNMSDTSANNTFYSSILNKYEYIKNLSNGTYKWTNCDYIIGTFSASTGVGGGSQFVDFVYIFPILHIYLIGMAGGRMLFQFQGFSVYIKNITSMNEYELPFTYEFSADSVYDKNNRYIYAFQGIRRK